MNKHLPQILLNLPKVQTLKIKEEKNPFQKVKKINKIQINLCAL